jgi:pimeloyl-ACP methyl ester carboxylesterase
MRSRFVPYRRPAVLAAACAALTGTLATGAADAAPATSATRPAPRSATADCPDLPRAECGTVRVPLRRAQPGLGTTTVAYMVIRHANRSRPAAGTVAVNPGGPGASAIAEAATFAGLFGDLLDDHDLLLVDPRGVNRSDPIDCGPAGAIGQVATRDDLTRWAGNCGRVLGSRARAYTSAETADDIDAVRAKLGVDRLDLLGESYGTYLMQVYAQRHPRHVRSIVLSSAYPLDFDMWGRPTVRAARRAIRLMCERSGGRCDGERVLADVARLSERLRRDPIGYETDGRRRLLDDTTLASVVYQAASDAPGGLADVPRMVRAALRGDNELLVGAARELLTPVSGSAGSVRTAAPASEEQPFNVGQTVAVVCNDYPTLWDRRASVPVRLRQFAAGRAALPESTFWPFGKRAWTSGINDRGNLCVRWPDRHGSGRQTGAPFPDVPVLVMSGDMDTNTPTEEGRLAARRFKRAAVVEVPNVGHVPEQEPSGCAAGIGMSFIRTLKVGDTSCLAKIPPVSVS